MAIFYHFNNTCSRVFHDKHRVLKHLNINEVEHLWSIHPLHLDVPISIRALGPEILHPMWTDKHYWKPYLTATSLVGGKNQVVNNHLSSLLNLTCLQIYKYLFYVCSRQKFANISDNIWHLLKPSIGLFLKGDIYSLIQIMMSDNVDKWYSQNSSFRYFVSIMAFIFL